MNLNRGIALTCFLLVFATGALAQDSLLGKKKGGGTSSPPQSSSGSGSKKQDKKADSSSRDREDGSRKSNQSSSLPNHYVPTNNQKPKYQPRSGRVSYGTVNNLLEKQGTKRAPIQIQPAPTQRAMSDETTSMRDQMRREDRSRVRDRDRNRNDRGWDRGDDFRWGKLRVGYYQYDRGFRDDYFCYPHYVFNPYQVDRCVVSPWYYYSYLPGYVDYTRITTVSPFMDVFTGFPYTYIGRGRDRSDYEARGGGYDGYYLTRRKLDYVIDDIVDAFMEQDRRAIDRLVPRNGGVTLAVDGTTSYGVRAEDFYDMMMDAVTNSRTIDYEILDVRQQNEEAEVVAKHDYLDSWGGRQCVYHKYRLVGERYGGIVIRAFETANQYYWN